MYWLRTLNQWAELRRQIWGGKPCDNMASGSMPQRSLFEAARSKIRWFGAPSRFAKKIMSEILPVWVEPGRKARA